MNNAIKSPISTQTVSMEAVTSLKKNNTDEFAIYTKVKISMWIGRNIFLLKSSCPFELKDKFG